MKKTFFMLLLLICKISVAQIATNSPNNLKLWYNRPASNWDEALPIGNGTLGAMVFGYALSERLQLNESSVWAGSADDFVNPLAKASLPEIRNLLFQKKYIEAQQ